MKKMIPLALTPYQVQLENCSFPRGKTPLLDLNKV